MPKTIVDFFGKGQASGLAAHLSKTNPGKMRPFIGSDGKAYVQMYKSGDPAKPESYQKIQVNDATLLKDEWKQLDTAVIKIAESRLNGVQDLIDRGLTFNLTNSLGTTILESQEMSDAMEAELTMDGVHRGKGDRVVYSTTYLPLPIIHVDYDINERVLSASRSLGNPLDTAQAERAARKVAERLEQMLFTDEQYSAGGGVIYSYLNHPDINEVSLALAWDDSAKTGAKIVRDVMDMKIKSIADFHYGPWMLYIPTEYESVLDEDYDVSGSSLMTVRERIMKISGILGIKVVDTLPDDNVLLVQMTSDVVRLVRGLPFQNVQWGAEGGMTTHFKVMTIQVPQIRSDYNKRSGITLLA